MRTTQLKYENLVIIIDPALRKVLLLPSDSGWTLPKLPSATPHYWQEVTLINQAVLEKLHLNVRTLRCVKSHFNQAASVVSRIYLQEKVDAITSEPSGTKWIEYSELSKLEPDFEWHRELSESITDTEQSSPLDPAWYKPHWAKAAVAWVYEQLSRLGLAPIGGINQLRSWHRSSVWSINTRLGFCVFKAVPMMFVYEPLLTMVLAEQFPRNIPEVLAVDHRRGWFITRGVGSDSLNTITEPTYWEKALQDYAQMQIASSSYATTWLNIGCADYRLEKLIERAGALLTDTSSLMAGGINRLSEAEIEQLRRIMPNIKRRCVDLAGDGIPHTLEHGDFNPQQVIVTNGTYIYLDWSDACLTHPFFSLAMFLKCLENQTGGVTSEVSIRLLDAYLEPWTIYESKASLIESFKIVESLSGLYCGLKYCNLILPGTAHKWEAENSIPYWFRVLLQENI